MNDYLRELSGLDITAKDFRTWAGTVQAALALTELGAGENATHAKRNLKLAIERVAARLGNTITICRKCYIHPQIIECYLEGALVLETGGAAAAAESALTPEEAAVFALLRGPVNALERPAA